MYSNPPYRATIYVLGILLGYALRVHRNIKLTTTQMLCGWTVSVLLFLSVLILPLPMGRIGYVYNEYHAATFAAFGPMAWCGIFAWIIFTTHIGYSSMISLLLVAFEMFDFRLFSSLFNRQSERTFILARIFGHNSSVICHLLDSISHIFLQHRPTEISVRL